VDEMRRVASRVVIFTFEPAEVGRFWLTEAYFPEIVALDRGRGTCAERSAARRRVPWRRRMGKGADAIADAGGVPPVCLRSRRGMGLE
jgi:hypothetical protein